MAEIVVDIGNSRVKWGQVVGRDIIASVSLPPEEVAIWEKQLNDWRINETIRWVMAAVRPPTLCTLLDWVRKRGDFAQVLEGAAQLPLKVQVPEPDKVGIDRLLAAVGVNARRSKTPHANTGAVVIGVGTAITVDVLDREGVFLGGAIMPGPRLMGQALHEHTALLPLVETIPLEPDAPAKATYPAIELGIHWAMVGGVNSLIQELGRDVTPASQDVEVFVAGGGASLLLHRLVGNVQHCPELVLEGICLTAKSMS